LFAQRQSNFVFAAGLTTPRPAGYYPFRHYPAPVLPRRLPPKIG
jgi:hypothetical protein